MKLSVWARKQGISYQTAWRWWADGKLPVPAEQMPTGTVIIRDEDASVVAGAVALYARVSSADQKNDLDGQLGRLAAYAAEQRMTVVKAVGEIGSGLNGHRPKLLKLLADPTVAAIVVEHRDRLMRFGFEYVESALRAQKRLVIIMNPGEVKDDLVQDMIEVLTSFCARLYGRRSARHKAEKAVKAIEQG
jgi:predicted site-specific integrase-resolvase